MERILEGIEGARVHLPPIDEGILKMFAVVTMAVDHISYAFLERAYTAYGQPLMSTFDGGVLLARIGRTVGRQSFPIFCFFLVEGFFHTRSRPRYFARLMFFAALSQYPFQKDFFPRSETFHANVLVTLGIGLLAIWTIEELRLTLFQSGKDYGRILFFFAAGGSVYGFCRLAAFLQSDYRYGGVVMIVLMYLLREYRITSLFVSWIWLSWYNRLELYSAPAFLLLACYNGKRGKQSKYFYYIFYPAHLLIILLVRRRLFPW